MTVYPFSPRPIRSCLARTIPSTTPSTVSRWEGLAARDTRVLTPSVPVNVPAVPRWYLTSPVPAPSMTALPSNSSKTWL